jgi:hypothetical protein
MQKRGGCGKKSLQFGGKSHQFSNPRAYQLVMNLSKYHISDRPGNPNTEPSSSYEIRTGILG